MNINNKTSHYIIDGKKRQEYLAIFFVFITISFGVGYTFGYMHGTPVEAEGTIVNAHEIAPLSTGKSPSDQTTKLKDKNLSDSQITKAQKEKTSSNGQHIEPKKVNANPVQVAKPIKPKPSPPILKKRANPQKAKVEPEPTVIQPAPKIKTLNVKNPQPKVVIKKSVADPINKIKAISKTTDNNPTQYLVQVGLFASRENASSFIDQLAKSGFKGYFEGFISTSGVEKYNVRLGPFTNKSTAQEKMSEFKKTHNSSAYILTHK